VCDRARPNVRLRGGTDPAACVDRVITRTRQYAKRQETFFRSVKDAVFIDVSLPGYADEVRTRIARFQRRAAPQ